MTKVRMIGRQAKTEKLRLSVSTRAKEIAR